MFCTVILRYLQRKSSGSSNIRRKYCKIRAQIKDSHSHYYHHGMCPRGRNQIFLLDSSFLVLTQVTDSDSAVSSLLCPACAGSFPHFSYKPGLICQVLIHAVFDIGILILGRLIWMCPNFIFNKTKTTIKRNSSFFFDQITNIM